MSSTPIEFPKLPSRHSPRPSRETAPGSKEAPSKTTIADPVPAFQATAKGAAALAPIIDIDHLYPASSETRPDLLKALRLMADAVSALESARAACARNNEIDADRYVQRLQMMLEDLFSCRKLGDGYANTINSIHFSLINQHGKPLTARQISAVWRTLKELRAHPFMGFEDSLQLVDGLSDTELEVTPSFIGELLQEEDE